MLKACIGFLKIELDPLKRMESTGCEMKKVSCKVADAKGNMNSLADGMHKDTFDSYCCIPHNFNQSLVMISRYLKDMIDCEATALQQAIATLFAMQRVVSKVRILTLLRMWIEA